MKRYMSKFSHFINTILFTVFTLLFFVLIFPSGVYSYKMFWKTVGSSGTAGENEGLTLGQTAAERVSGATYYGPGSYGFWYSDFVPELCIDISPNEWNVDSVRLMETISMVLGDEITVNNCGNCHLNLGLYYSGSRPITWDIAIFPGMDKFALRAHFTETASPPAVYDPYDDHIDDFIIWSDGVIFGYPGYDLNVAASVYLWLQFVSPTETSAFGDNQLTIIILSQVNLP